MTTIVETFTVGTQSGRETEGGSAAELTLNPPFQVPPTATSVSLKLRSSYIWNTFLNVNTELGNRLTVIDNQTNIEWTFIFPDGQYNVDSIFEYFSRDSKQRGAPWVGTPGNVMLLRIDADDSVQKIVFTNNTAGRTFTIDWSGDFNDGKTPTIWKLLGFDPTTVTILPGTETDIYGSYAYGSTQALFNTVNAVLLKCSLVTRGIRLNGQYQGVLAQVPITEGPGSLMVYEPQQQPMNEPSLSGGSTIRTVGVQICNELGEPVFTPGNPWLVTIDISYDLIE